MRAEPAASIPEMKGYICFFGNAVSMALQLSSAKGMFFMSEVNQRIYVQYLRKELEALDSWTNTLRLAKDWRAGEMERRANNVRRAISLVLG
ncbi:hypothetical protein HU230_0015985 [Bradyrhizobium quebecense]|uniref:Uncharacterized protein n=1 Tax=Bradyrhizobium quebecense TaxID=2748629 RepID=A0A973WLX0_9BRAD|nr:hypothetical protein [Bradyrhizobium quebecense]UGA47447.1 hypothetical protein HU230_0015985 [Bradyrhizobium quebecense]